MIIQFQNVQKNLNKISFIEKFIIYNFFSYFKNYINIKKIININNKIKHKDIIFNKFIKNYLFLKI